MHLALFLLAVIGVACTIATFAEAKFNAKIAQHYIYKAPWFLFWLALLCINLFAVTLTRWPWQKKHIGFVLTHYGIIVLLIGAAIGMHLGFEGNVTLRTTDPPTDRITINRSILQIEDPNSFALYVLPFDASVTQPTPRRPRIFQIPGAHWRIVATDFAPNLERAPELVESPTGAPVALLRFDGATAATSQTLALSLGSPPASLFGMAQIFFTTQLPHLSSNPIEETSMFFAKWEPVRQGHSTGADAFLEQNGDKVRLRGPSGDTAVFRVNEILYQKLQFDGLEWEALGYWPDFEMHDGKPATRSNLPQNPALLLRIRGNAPSLASGVLPKSLLNGLALVLAPAENGQLAYSLLRNGREQARGTLAQSQTIATGWNDWTLTLTQFLPHGKIIERSRPAPLPNTPAPGRRSVAIHGFLAQLVVPQPDGSELLGDETWIESGQITTLTAGSTRVRLGYGLQLQQVPFTIRLVKFEVPRFEGTEQPSNFISTLEFRDKATGETKTGVAKMNHPANWPGGFWPLISGWNYKFSQAEWNPRDLSETTLQVLYDPGWLLKWIGSLAICIGIALLFYWKPRKQPAPSTQIADENIQKAETLLSVPVPAQK